MMLHDEVKGRSILESKPKTISKNPQDEIDSLIAKARRQDKEIAALTIMLEEQRREAHVIEEHRAETARMLEEQRTEAQMLKELRAKTQRLLEEHRTATAGIVNKEPSALPSAEELIKRNQRDVELNAYMAGQFNELVISLISSLSSLIGRSIAQRIFKKSLLRSGAFDPEWYKARYRDVKDSGMDPLQHYLRYGIRESRTPSSSLQYKSIN